MRRTARCIGSVSRFPENSYPKLFLNAWNNQPRKNGAPQLSCNNNFAKAITNILPGSLSNNQAIFREWLPITKDEKTWQAHIKNFFNNCRTTDDKDEQDEESSFNPENSSPDDPFSSSALHETEKEINENRVPDIPTCA
jgi:hypothetical protein